MFELYLVILLEYYEGREVPYSSSPDGIFNTLQSAKELAEQLHNLFDKVIIEKWNFMNDESWKLHSSIEYNDLLSNKTWEIHV